MQLVNIWYFPGGTQESYVKAEDGLYAGVLRVNLFIKWEVTDFFFSFLDELNMRQKHATCKRCH
jgi:hypothetical protein